MTWIIFQTGLAQKKKATCLETQNQLKLGPETRNPDLGSLPSLSSPLSLLFLLVLLTHLIQDHSYHWSMQGFSWFPIHVLFPTALHHATPVLDIVPSCPFYKMGWLSLEETVKSALCGSEHVQCIQQFNSLVFFQSYILKNICSIFREITNKPLFYY